MTKRLLLCASACLALVSCSVKDNHASKIEVKVSVCQDNLLSKTTLSGNSFSWSSGDAIGLYAGIMQPNVQMTFTSGTNFSGTFDSVEDSPIKNVPFYAYYPYSGSAEGTTVTGEVPASQTAPFDSRYDYMLSSVAYALYDESDMHIPDLSMNRHLCSLAQIRIASDNVAYSSYKVNGVLLYSASADIAGTLSFDVSNGNVSYTGGGHAIALTYPTASRPTLGSGTIVLNAVLMPCTVSDLVVTVLTDHGEFSVSTGVSVEFAANTQVVLPEITGFTLDSQRPIIFMGDSITAFWASKRTFFTEYGFTGKGISGNWTSDMKSRFATAVTAYEPKAVIINGGVNNIAHPYKAGTDIDIDALVQDIKDMADMAIDADIQPILTTICPTGRGWKPIEPYIVEANALIIAYAAAQGLPLVDYHAAMVGSDGYLPDSYADDGCHPTAIGYAVMEATCLPVINHVLGRE